MTTRGLRRMGELPAAHTPADVATRVNRLLRSPLADAVVMEVTLSEGLNKVQHGLGVTVPHFIVAAPSTTGVSIASAQAENAYPDKTLWVRMAGAAEVKTLLVLLLKVE